MKNSGLCIISMLGGALLGSALTMFLTPKSGAEMRDSLRGFVDKQMDKVRCNCDEEGAREH